MTPTKKLFFQVTFQKLRILLVAMGAFHSFPLHLPKGILHEPAQLSFGREAAKVKNEARMQRIGKLQGCLGRGRDPCWMTQVTHLSKAIPRCSQATESQTPTLGVSFKCGPPIQLNQGVLEDNPVGIAPSTYQEIHRTCGYEIENPKQ